VKRTGLLREQVDRTVSEPAGIAKQSHAFLTLQGGRDP
jgi:hypothetical protein